MMDKRTIAVCRQLEEWSPADDVSLRSKTRTLDFLKAAEKPFSRDADRSHITGSALVVSSAGVLMHMHKLISRWVGPGGHVDGDEETPWEAAEREVLEETGIRAWSPTGNPILIHVDAHETVTDHNHYDLRYLLVANPDCPNPPAGESQQVAWFGRAGALEATDESFAAAFRAGYGIEVEIPR